MIVKSNARGGKGWAKYLLESKENDRAEVLDIRGVVFDDNLHLAIAEMSISGGRYSKPFLAASIDPAIGEDKTMTPERWMRSIEILEKKLGMEGQPRFAVLHEKKGRTHIHVGWSRYDREKGTLRSDSNLHHKSVAAKEEMEIEFGHTRTPKYFTEKAQGRVAKTLLDLTRQEKAADLYADNKEIVADAGKKPEPEPSLRQEKFDAAADAFAENKPELTERERMIEEMLLKLARGKDNLSRERD
ncbi:hypothetical protein J0X19_11830 [Hymenobacter sp. BT186]|uniref:MobA/VirD2-like nuclease domain-containing protein n=1 Tax=Hymenobacter telluris TaxID=2816474 RepID=A0A939EWT2_9BACT|nr:hypothetical protein [Hymenobacter telluris]MBO0358637.1 hypothetical protein [Hymenobacter telluris]MBW3374663.1 hypothetical protein [Hymenobacter norwichensis]